jgi:hypothetical protein
MGETFKRSTGWISNTILKPCNISSYGTVLVLGTSCLNLGFDGPSEYPTTISGSGPSPCGVHSAGSPFHEKRSLKLRTYILHQKEFMILDKEVPEVYAVLS